MRQLKRRVTVCLIAMMAAGSVSPLAFADSTEGSRSYGPALTLTGPEADLASKIHSGTNLKIDVPEGGNLAGTLVARGKYNVMLIDGTKGTIGKDDGKADDTITIIVHSKYLDSAFIKNHYDLDKDYSGTLTVNDPIVAKAEKGGTIQIEGKNMNFNLLYAHKNQWYEPADEEEYHSSVIVHLTGDLAYGDANNEIGDRRNDWISQSGIAGGSYRVGDIQTRSGEGIISVDANFMTINSVSGFEETEITLKAKNFIKANNVSNRHESKLTMRAKTIEMNGLGTNSDLAETVVGDENTESLTVHDSVVLSGGRSKMALTGKSIHLEGGLEFDETSTSSIKSKTADTFSIKGNDVSMKGNIILAGDEGTIEADTLTLEGKKVQAKGRSNVSISANTINGTMDSLNLDLLDTRNPKEEYKNTVTIAAKNGGTLAIKDPIMVKEGGNTLDIHGLENLSAGALIMDAASYAEAADSSVTLGAENISLESIANTKGNARNGKPVDQSISISHSGTAKVEAGKMLTLEGGVKNINGTAVLSAPEAHLYRVQSVGSDVYAALEEGAETTVNADSLSLDTSASAIFLGNKVTINAKELKFNPEGHYYEAAPADPDQGIPYDVSADADGQYKDEGTVWASYGGVMDINISKGGTFEGAAAVDNEKMNIDKDLAMYAKYPDYKERFGALLANKAGKVNVSLDEGSQWNVTKDSTASSLSMKQATLNLSGKDAPVTLTTDDFKSENGTLAVKVTDDAHSLLNTKTASGTVYVSANGEKGVTPASELAKTKIMSFDQGSSVTLKGVTTMTDESMYGIVTPVSQDESAGYVGGKYEVDKNVVSDKALRTIGAVRRAGRFIMAGMDVPLYPDSNDENVWAHWSRGNYGPGDWSGSHNDLAAGVDLYHTDHSRAGISVMHTNSSLDRTENLGEVSMKKKFTRVSLYGCHDFAGGLHAAGDVFAGGIRIKDTSLVDMSTRTAGVHAEVGVDVPAGRGTITPLVRAAYAGIRGFTTKDGEGFPFTMKESHYSSFSAGLKASLPLSPVSLLTAYAGWGIRTGYDIDGTMSDAWNTMDISESGKEHVKTLGIGYRCDVTPFARLSLSAAREFSSGLHDDWNFQVSAAYKF